MEDRIPIEAHMSGIETAVDHIAYIRRMAEVEGHDMEEFDAEMNKVCKRYHEKYAKMDKLRLMLKGMADILRSEHAEEFIADLARDLRE